MEILRNNYEHRGIKYLVCSNGDIYGPTGRKLKPRRSNDGYAIVTMTTSHALVVKPDGLPTRGLAPAPRP